MKILVFGAGKSALYCIHYLLQNAGANGWQVSVADSSGENLQLSTKGFGNANTILADVHNDVQRRQIVEAHDIIISLLPARFHILVAQDCLELGKHLITPSYLTPEISAMHNEARQKGLFFINELGLDPGIDHMSAMKIIDELQSKGAEIESFKSYCGGLVARESDTNPWHYKFSWNPYNVIRAGQDGALYLDNGQYRFVPYHHLFKTLQTFTLGNESFDGYLNRNSERYIELYKLREAKTFIRGTLRYKNFCRLWQLFVDSGLTNDAISIRSKQGTSWQEYFKIFFPGFPYIGSEKNASDSLQWLISDVKTPVPAEATPAQALQVLLEEKWKMQLNDKDRVVMIHELIYRLGEKYFRLKSWLDLTGENNLHTAMAKTVGLPLALAAELISQNKLHKTGVLMPTEPEIYTPLMQKLSLHGITFREEIKPV